MKEIVYCEGDRNYSRVHFVRRPTLLLSVTPGILHERLGEQGFLRISRSVLVNKACIAQYGDREITPHNGLMLPLARRRRKQIEQILHPFFHSR